MYCRRSVIANKFPDSPSAGSRDPSRKQQQLWHQRFSTSSSGEYLDVPRMHRGVTMWRLVSWTFCLIVSLQPGPWSGWAAADELESQVKIEVLFKPFPCAPKSKKGDMINVHYDGFLAKDGSQFYCRLVPLCESVVVNRKSTVLSLCLY